jgi:hypothetical protein
MINERSAMNLRMQHTKRIRLALILLLLASLAGPAYAQSCALCYTQAASAGARMVQGLRSGILILIFPPMAICLGITVMSYKKRNHFRRDESTRTSNLGW